MTTAYKYLTISEAATFARVPIATVRHWVYTDQLPATKRGRHRLIREDAIVKFLEGDKP
jgi:excisionase family DNA binding protein